MKRGRPTFAPCPKCGGTAHVYCTQWSGATVIIRYLRCIDCTHRFKVTVESK